MISIIVRTVNMLVDVSKILNNRGQSVVDKIRANMGSSNASGATSRSIRYVVTKSSMNDVLQIWGRKYFRAMETGIKPYPQYTKASKKFVEAIRQWLTIRGGNPKHAYGVALAIHQKGTALWRKGGRKDIFSNVINPAFFESLERELLQEFGNRYILGLKQLYDNSPL